MKRVPSGSTAPGSALEGHVTGGQVPSHFGFGRESGAWRTMVPSKAELWNARRSRSPATSAFVPFAATRIVWWPSAPRAISRTPSTPGVASSPDVTVPSAAVTVQAPLRLVIANSMSVPVPDPLNGSGNGVSRTEMGVRTMSRAPPLQASSRLSGLVPAYENTHSSVSRSTSIHRSACGQLGS